MARLEPGMSAPDFEAQDATGRTWTLRDLKGRRVILYFYPADDTPGCTIEACDFRDNIGGFEEAGYVVLGVSSQGAESHRAFTDKYDLNFPLLIDEDLTMAGAYGATRDREFFNDVPLDIKRSTFIIDENGEIADALYGVHSKGHVADLLERVGG